MNEEKSRAEFEAWCEVELNLRTARLVTGDYQSFGADMAWRAWQASRAAVVVELPADDEIPHSKTAIGMKYMAIQAIEAAGLKVSK